MHFRFFSLRPFFKGKPSSSIHKFTVRTLEEKPFNLASLAGKKLLIVNTASECGLTPQFEQLEDLYKKYRDKNFMVLGFPSNDFGQQEPGDHNQIKNFCERNYGVSFPMVEKISVKGESIHPIYKWLTSKSENGVMDTRVKWNFQKYLVDEKGHLVDSVRPWKRADSKEIVRWIEGSVSSS